MEWDKSKSLSWLQHCSCETCAQPGHATELGTSLTSTPVAAHLQSSRLSIHELVMVRGNRLKSNPSVLEASSLPNTYECSWYDDTSNRCSPCVYDVGHDSAPRQLRQVANPIRAWWSNPLLYAKCHNQEPLFTHKEEGSSTGGSHMLLHGVPNIPH